MERPDIDQLTEYIRRYGNTVYRVAYSYVKNAADSEDIVQDTFVKLMCADKGFDSEVHIKAWLIRVAANLAKDMLRSPRVSRREPLDDSIPARETADSGVSQAVGSLDPKYGAVIYLHYYEGYGVREIASMLGLTEGNVKVRLKRGREKLKAILTDE